MAHHTPEHGIRRPAKTLTVAFVRSVSEPGKYFDGNGLYLRVLPGGSRQWVQRIIIRGRRREIGLGGTDLVSLAEARHMALENRKLARSGGDPFLARKPTRQVPTFAEAMVSAHGELTFGNPKDQKAFLTNLETYAVPHFGAKQIDEITGPDIRAAVMAIRDTKPEIARKLILRCSAVFKWAVGEGFRADNPATADGLALPAVGRKAKLKNHRKALPYGQVGHCIAAVHRSGAFTSTKLAIEFLILTAVRSGEVRGATWAEIDIPAKTWTIPAARMKMASMHSVPLSPRACEILEEARKHNPSSDLIFPSRTGKPLSDMTLSKLIKELGFDADVHGFRTSFRTWAQECTEYPHEVAEAALAHKIGDTATQAYARSTMLEKRRAMMADWASFIHGTA